MLPRDLVCSDHCGVLMRILVFAFPLSVSTTVCQHELGIHSPSGLEHCCDSVCFVQIAVAFQADSCILSASSF